MVRHVECGEKRQADYVGDGIDQQGLAPDVTAATTATTDVYYARLQLPATIGPTAYSQR